MKHLIIFLFILFCNKSFSEESHKHNHHEHGHEHEEKENKKISLEAHIHGVSILNLIQEANTLSFEFEMPGYDIVGFEYIAKKKEDIKKVKNALNILADYKNMIAPSLPDNCEIINTTAKINNAGKHSEFIGEYIFNCANINQIDNIEIKFFDSFENSKLLNINLLSNNKKKSLEVDRSNNILDVSGYFN